MFTDNQESHDIMKAKKSDQSTRPKDKVSSDTEQLSDSSGIQEETISAYSQGNEPSDYPPKESSSPIDPVNQSFELDSHDGNAETVPTYLHEIKPSEYSTKEYDASTIDCVKPSFVSGCPLLKDSSSNFQESVDHLQQSRELKDQIRNLGSHGFQSEDSITDDNTDKSDAPTNLFNISGVTESNDFLGFTNIDSLSKEQTERLSQHEKNTTKCDLPKLSGDFRNFRFSIPLFKTKQSERTHASNAARVSVIQHTNRLSQFSAKRLMPPPPLPIIPERLSEKPKSAARINKDRPVLIVRPLQKSSLDESLHATIFPGPPSEQHKATTKQSIESQPAIATTLTEFSLRPESQYIPILPKSVQQNDATLDQNIESQSMAATASPKALQLSTSKKKVTYYNMFVCDICQKRLENGYDYCVHAFTHIPEEPYKCHKCGAEFTQKLDLFNHRRCCGQRPTRQHAPESNASSSDAEETSPQT